MLKRCLKECLKRKQIKKESLEMIENVTSFSGTMSGDKKFINENI